MFKGFLLFVLLFCSPAQAQMVDVRALSQKGRQAYPRGVVRPVEPIRYPEPASVARPAAVPMKQEPTLAAAKTAPGGVEQKGIKIFREEDEDKILKMDVKNPEFDRLSDAQKQNVLKRIALEEK